MGSVVLAVALGLAVCVVVPAFAGSAAAQGVDDADETVTASELEGELFYGQTVAIENVTAFEENQSVSLRHGDGQESSSSWSYRVSDDGSVPIDTADVQPGRYVVHDADGEYGPFEITRQEVEVGFVDDQIDTDGETALVVEEDDRGTTVDLLVDAFGDLNASELGDAIGGEEFETSKRDGDTVRVHGVSSEDVIPVQATHVDPGLYGFTVEVADTGATSEAVLSVGESASAGPRFSEPAVTEHVGDVAEVSIETDGESDELWLWIQNRFDSYDVTVRLTDVDRDGPVTLRQNTHHARDAEVDAGLEADGATVANVSAAGRSFDLSGTLTTLDDGWTLGYELYENESAIDDGDAVDRTFVNVEPRATRDLTTYTAPGVDTSSHDALDHDDDIAAILDSATERNTVADGDLLIAEVEVSGVFGYLNADPATFASDGFQFELVGPTDGSGATPSIPIADLEGAATITERPDDDRFFVVIDSSEVPEIEAGETWEATFSIDGRYHPYVTDGNFDGPERFARDAFTYEDREIELTGAFEGDRLLLPAEENAEITATTNVAPGTEVDLRVNLPRDSLSRDFPTASGTVTADGTISETVDTSEYGAGTQLRSVRVRAPASDSLVASEGVLYDPDGATVLASADAPSVVETGDVATLDIGVTNVGGDAGEETVTVTAADETVFENTVHLEAGEQWNESIDLDTDELGTVQWTVATSAENSSGELAVATDGEFDGYEPLPDDGTDLHYDVNGDGSVTNSDVTTFFAHQHTPAWNERPDLFDFDGNGDVGQSDVVELFEYVNGADRSTSA